MCLFPKIIKNRRYTATKKNRGVIPPIFDKRVLDVPVGCGKCIECRKKKQREWQVRLKEELKNGKKAYFVTFTFSEESLTELDKQIDERVKGYERDNAIAKKAVRRFLERWRKRHKKSVRHWLVTELGQDKTERIHLHGIIWTEKEHTEITERWGYGITTIGERKYDKRKELNKKNLGWVNEETVGYIVKYLGKADEKHKEYKSIILTSSGIGRGYMDREDSKNNKYKEKATNELYRDRKGYKIALPIYYRNKIYTDEEREKLWLEKLDKKERYVLGEKIDVSKDDENYYKALKWAREKNKRLGYGDNSKDWDRIRYERERRNLIKKERVQKKWANEEKLKRMSINDAFGDSPEG